MATKLTTILDLAKAPRVTNVLVISQDREVLNLLSEFSSVHLGPANVKSCPTGPTALEHLQSVPYELVFLDTRDTHLSELLTKIRRLQPKALTVVITESQNRKLIGEALRFGAYDFLTRPIIRDYLGATLKRISQHLRLAECAQTKDDLLASLLHALRTPLNVILNWIQVWRSESADERVDVVATEMIEKSAKEQAELLANFERASLSLANPVSSLAALAGSTQIRKVAPSTPGLKTAPRIALRSLERVKILVVDDDRDSRTLLAIMLSQTGAQVIAVASVKEALAQFQSSVPDILISDIGMPGEDGYGLIRSVRQLSPEAGGIVPALALTAYAASDDHDKTLQAGFDAYLSKPVEPVCLEQAVVKLICLIPKSDEVSGQACKGA
jgi:CheY-like chemotaxis protein